MDGSFTIRDTVYVLATVAGLLLFVWQGGGWLARKFADQKTDSTKQFTDLREKSDADKNEIKLAMQAQESRLQEHMSAIRADLEKNLTKVETTQTGHAATLEQHEKRIDRQKENADKLWAGQRTLGERVAVVETLTRGKAA